MYYKISWLEQGQSGKQVISDFDTHPRQPPQDYQDHCSSILHHYLHGWLEGDQSMEAFSSKGFRHLTGSLSLSLRRTTQPQNWRKFRDHKAGKLHLYCSLHLCANVGFRLKHASMICAIKSQLWGKKWWRPSLWSSSAKLPLRTEKRGYNLVLSGVKRRNLNLSIVAMIMA